LREELKRLSAFPL